MHSIQIDRQKKRLYVKLAGFFVDEEAKKASDKIIEAIDTFNSDFDLITDISECRPATPAGNVEIERIQKYALSKGAKRFIRVVGQRVLAQMQLDRASKKTGVEADYAGSIEEANRLLERQS